MIGEVWGGGGQSWAEVGWEGDVIGDGGGGIATGQKYVKTSAPRHAYDYATSILCEV